MGYIDMAKEIEKQGITHYRNLVQQCRHKELAGIFEYFLREEYRHFEIFDAWQKNEKIPEIVKTDGVRKAKDFFQKLTEDIKSLGVPAIDHEDAYLKALALEKNSISAYKEILKKTEDTGQKKQLEFIIAQEEFHRELVESLMEFQRHPYEWLENAEWNHFGEY